MELFEENLHRFGFSSREKDIIRLLRKGLNRKAIADVLFIATNTVSRHLQNIFTNADAKNRVELMHKLDHNGGGNCT